MFGWFARSVAAAEADPPEADTAFAVRRTLLGSLHQQAELRDRLVADERAAILKYAPQVERALDHAIELIRVDADEHRTNSERVYEREWAVTSALDRRMRTAEGVIGTTRSALVLVAILAVSIGLSVWLQARTKGGIDIEVSIVVTLVCAAISAIVAIGDVLVARRFPPAPSTRFWRVHVGLAVGHACTAALSWSLVLQDASPGLARALLIGIGVAIAAHLGALACNAPEEARARALGVEAGRIAEARADLEARERELIADAHRRLDDVLVGVDAAALRAIARDTERRLSRHSGKFARLSRVLARMGIRVEPDETPPRVGETIVEALIVP